MLTVTFLTVAAILSIVFVVLTVDARRRVRAAETARLQASGRMFAALEASLQRVQLATIETLAENPTLKAALDTYLTERHFSGTMAPDQEHALRRTVTIETEALARVTGADVLAVLDNDDRIYASAGPLSGEWPPHQQVDLPGREFATFEGIVALPAGAFRMAGTPLRIGDREIGTLVLGTKLDVEYARQLAALSNAGVVISVNGAPVASTVRDVIAAALLQGDTAARPTRTLEGEEYAVATLLSSGPASIHTLSSVDAAGREETRDALAALATVALGGFVLAAVGSFVLARTLSDPINRVSNAIATMTAARDFGRTLDPSGASRELDALTTAFNGLMRDVRTAEAETEAAYLGAIRALAAALDARDPYTAGHSERVSTLSVLAAREMSLDGAAVEVIRLGALLHDIGKIGVTDAVLRKAGPLSPAEYEQIKRHPALGARILRQVGFLAPHLPIVELHHERPDGRGYPFGLRGDDIPLAARIVHVADAYDAMTSARAYRPARDTAFAVAELKRGAGSEFDAASVEALCRALASEAEGPSGADGRAGRVRRHALATCLALLASAAPAAAQQAYPSRVAVESVAAVDETVDGAGSVSSGVILDSVVSIDVGRGFEGVVRPFAQRLGTGEWNRQIWVAALRYERGGRVDLRVDAGLIPPPVGLANLALRPHLNPVIAQPASLFTPLPALVTGGPRTTLLGAVYPYGVHVAASAPKWDARAALMDTSPLRARRVFARANPPRFANVVLGAGMTPVVGVRIGASVTRGGWLKAGESPAITQDADATIVTLESEVAFRHTRLTGEWVRDTVAINGASHVADGWFVQGQQTVTARWFAAGRLERMSSAAIAMPGLPERQRFTGSEETIGYRLTPEITLRASHRSRRGFARPGFDHSAAVSIVWWKRWI